MMFKTCLTRPFHRLLYANFLPMIPTYVRSMHVNPKKPKLDESQTKFIPKFQREIELGLGGHSLAMDTLAVEARKGDVDAQYGFARICFEQVLDEERGMQYLIRAAKQGHVKAMAQASQIYLERALNITDEKTRISAVGKPFLTRLSGDRVQQGKLGVKWLLRCAKAGDGQAQFNLGQLYYQGLIVARRLAKAIHWFEQAAEAQVPGALYNLGLCHYEAVDVEAGDDLEIKEGEMDAKQHVNPSKND